MKFLHILKTFNGSDVIYLIGYAATGVLFLTRSRVP